MNIYIVQPGDTINSIAEKYGVNVEKLINDNGLEDPEHLAVGQTIVIAYPKQSYTVQQGDTLQSIADAYHVTVMQLLRNNPYISDRGFLNPGESLTISYNVNGTITTNGFAFPFINHATLIKTLPSLTYLSILNYRITDDTQIYTYYDDTEIVNTAKEYEVIPLLLITVLTLQGEPDVDTAYKILLSEENQVQLLNEFIDIMKNKGYRGINIVFNLVNTENQSLYRAFVQRISERLKQEGLLFLITINYSREQINENIDYSQFSIYADNIIFLQLIWGNNYGPPAPVININFINTIINQALSTIPPDKISIGNPTIGYDWQLPYIPNRTVAESLSINLATELAYNTNSIIQFDQDSQTPYFIYYQASTGFPSAHIVWFIDARSINTLLDIIKEKKLNGNGVWSIMIYYPQLWLLINSQFDIVKIM